MAAPVQHDGLALMQYTGEFTGTESGILRSRLGNREGAVLTVGCPGAAHCGCLE